MKNRLALISGISTAAIVSALPRIDIAGIDAPEETSRTAPVAAIGTMAKGATAGQRHAFHRMKMKLKDARRERDRQLREVVNTPRE